MPLPTSASGLPPTAPLTAPDLPLRGRLFWRPLWHDALPPVAPDIRDLPIAPIFGPRSRLPSRRSPGLSRCQLRAWRQCLADPPRTQRQRQIEPSACARGTYTAAERFAAMGGPGHRRGLGGASRAPSLHRPSRSVEACADGGGDAAVLEPAARRLARH